MLKAFKFILASSITVFFSSTLIMLIVVSALILHFHIKLNQEVVGTSTVEFFGFILFIAALELILFFSLFKTYKTYFSFAPKLYNKINKLFLFLSVLAISVAMSIELIMVDYDKIEYKVSQQNFSHK